MATESRLSWPTWSMQACDSPPIWRRLSPSIRRCVHFTFKNWLCQQEHCYFWQKLGWKEDEHNTTCVVFSHRRRFLDKKSWQAILKNGMSEFFRPHPTDTQLFRRLVFYTFSSCFYPLIKYTIFEYGFCRSWQHSNPDGMVMTILESFLWNLNVKIMSSLDFHLLNEFQ